MRESLYSCLTKTRPQDAVLLLLSSLYQFEMMVQQVKLFKGVDTEMADLEKQINRFIRKNNIRVLSITGNLSPSPSAGSGPMNSFAGGDVLLILLYEVDVRTQ